MNFSRDNYVRIIIQTVNIYRDYIPQTIVTKYTKMEQYITKTFENPYYLQQDWRGSGGSRDNFTSLLKSIKKSKKYRDFIIEEL
jgi:hypothetical protein